MRGVAKIDFGFLPLRQGLDLRVLFLQPLLDQGFVALQGAMQRLLAGDAELGQKSPASVGAIALAGKALAADVEVPSPPVPLFTWTGAYLGGQVGYAWGNDPAEFNEFVPATPATPPSRTHPRGIPGTPAVFLSDPLGINHQGVIGGAHAGYNLQFNQWVVGMEGNLDGTSLSKTVLLPLIRSSVTETTRSDFQGSVRGRVGLSFDRALIYATGGVAFADLTNAFNDTAGFFTGTPGLTNSSSTTRVGWTVGGGLEYAVTYNWSVRAEYRYSDWGHAALVLLDTTNAVVTAHHHLTENQVQVGFSYKFDTYTLAPVIAKY